MITTIQSKITSKNISIGEYVIIRPNVKIGSNVTIHPYVLISSGTIIGNGVEIFPGAIIGREPNGAGATFRIPKFRKRILIEANSSIGSNAVIYYDVKIGRNTLIGDGASIREKCTIGSHCIISRYVTLNYNSKIGDRTKVMDSTHITGNSIIGKNVFISTMVGTANDNSTNRTSYDEKRIKGPTIQDHAFIGLGASLLPGVIVGNHAVVGAHSVVTKNVLPGTLVMGVPAKLIP